MKDKGLPNLFIGLLALILFLIVAIILVESNFGLRYLFDF
jgi:hypothetical protein